MFFINFMFVYFICLPCGQDEQVLDYLLTNLTLGDDGQVQWRDILEAFLNNFEHLEFSYPEGGRPCTKPALFIFGEKSIHYR